MRAVRVRGRFGSSLVRVGMEVGVDGGLPAGTALGDLLRERVRCLPWSPVGATDRVYAPSWSTVDRNIPPLRSWTSCTAGIVGVVDTPLIIRTS